MSFTDDDGESTDSEIYDCTGRQSKWHDHWKEVLDECEKRIVKTSGESNKYHMPEYFNYLKVNMLPIISMLSGMCLGDLTHISEKYERNFVITTNFWG